MAKCSPKASKKGRLVIKLVHKATGEFYTTTINDKTRKEEQKSKLSLMKYSKKLRKKVLFVQEKA
ncbi:50S ribosomal protein L33 [Candidatus Synchoanobacter obligatus]|uniref:Large ribosomal subunit protein bL33 n=1 Tax=Candidatus Synchoanobacter obligatus TaxID=2919597 RepID=A0ABT1L5A8_9GAMM|nr:50S ribosomal protein L33 [Candidatus Synchoanobacter obligatus]MCP8352279.1 50S ribosomal protein L33 [Candidatus Synchoanobacter obligatus]